MTRLSRSGDLFFLWVLACYGCLFAGIFFVIKDSALREVGVPYSAEAAADFIEGKLMNFYKLYGIISILSVSLGGPGGY